MSSCQRGPVSRRISEVIQTAGPARVLEMMLDRSVPFSAALASEIVAASKEADKSRQFLRLHERGVLARSIKDDRRGEVVAISTCL